MSEAPPRQSIHIYPKLWAKVLKSANAKGTRVWRRVCELLEAGLAAEGGK